MLASWDQAVRAKARAASLPIQRAERSEDGGEAGGEGACLGPEGGIALAADRLERPGDGLPHEVTIVAGGRLDQDEAAGEVGGAAMQREAGEEGEAGAAAELVGERGPGLDHRGCVRHAVEELEAGGVDDGPVVEVGPPAVHLVRGHLPGVIDQAGDRARLVPAGLPERGRQAVVGSEGLRDALHGGHGHAHRLFGDDAVARRHRVADPRRGGRFEAGEDRADRGRHGRSVRR